MEKGGKVMGQFRKIIINQQWKKAYKEVYIRKSQRGNYIKDIKEYDSG